MIVSFIKGNTDSLSFLSSDAAPYTMQANSMCTKYKSSSCGVENERIRFGMFADNNESKSNKHTFDLEMPARCYN